MNHIRSFVPYLVFSAIAAAIFIYGMGFAWTSMWKQFGLNVIVILFFEKLLGANVLKRFDEHKLIVVISCLVLALPLFAYGVMQRMEVDQNILVWSNDLLRHQLEKAMLFMSSAGLVFTFGGVTIFRRE